MRSTLLRNRRLLIGLSTLAAIGAVGGVAYAVKSGWISQDRSTTTVSLDTLGKKGDLELPNVNRPIAPEDAIKVNAERPFEAGDDTPAGRFLTGKAGKEDVARAIECLAQALYYEAGSESADGARAVAQVVLNRVRHPGYPPSVCGTVYQGSERVTGCQFTFTCDGSLRRIPSRAGWDRARKIATEALTKGAVFAPVGHATHYHANYVVPYWAASLRKQVQIGAHIFYRLPGALGGPDAFSQRYARNEPLPPSPTAAEVAAEAISEAVAVAAAPSLPDPLAAARGDAIFAPKAPPLIADETSGTLIEGIGALGGSPGCILGTSSRTDASSAAVTGKVGAATAC
jgi:spore germination cell wall hydrolase CwlJ-like protein